MKKSILFDMDGVILNSMPFHVRAWQEALAEHGLRVSDRLLYLHEGAIEPETATAVFSRNGCAITCEGFQEILQRQIEIFTRHYRSSIRPFPQVPKLLEALHASGWRLGLVTSSHVNILKGILPNNIASYMDCIITGDAVKRRKPFPDPYLEALKRMGVSCYEAIVVENAPAGIKAAKAANLPCLALKTTLEEEDLAGADLVVEDHVELKRYLLDRGLKCLP